MQELPESYLQVDFATLYGEGQMVLPEGVQAKVQPDANGLLLSGTVEEMNASAHHSVWCKGNMSIKVPDGYVNEFGGAVQESYGDMPMEMRGRGNSTWAPRIDRKKPYRIKFDKKQDLFGMGKNKNWVLLANAYDPTLMRNRVTLWLGRQIGMEFTPKCVPVEVVVDGDYYGSYLLCEQVRVGENRVDIADAKFTAPEQSGYLLSCSQEGEDPADVFHTEHCFDGLNVYPSKGDGGKVLDGYTIDAYHTYIRDYVQKMERQFKPSMSGWAGLSLIFQSLPKRRGILPWDGWMRTVRL